MTAQELDQAAVQAFAGQMLGSLNGAAATLLASIGHKIGLFDTMATLLASTSAQIAAAAGLKERYVREWLAGMTVSRFIAFHPLSGTYTLPAEHAALRTRAAGPGNMAVFAAMVPHAAGVESLVVDCFQHGGGVSYSEYGTFMQLFADYSSTVADATLVSLTLPLVPGLLERLQAGSEVADIGCGHGHVINVMATAYPKSRFTGYDFSAVGVAAARAEAAALGLPNASFAERDVANLGVQAGYDLLTVFDAIHDQAQPATVLRSMAEALRPDGTALIVDVAASSNLGENLEHPLAPFLYQFSLMHCMTVSLALDGAGRVSDDRATWRMADQSERGRWRRRRGARSGPRLDRLRARGPRIAVPSLHAGGCGALGSRRAFRRLDGAPSSRFHGQRPPR